MLAVSAWGIGLYLDLALRSTRWRLQADAETWALLTGRDGRTAIVVFWHEYLPLVTALWLLARRENPHLSLNVMISRHRDGRLIADVIRRWRINTVTGSSARAGKSEKGGAAALRHLLGLLRDGQVVTITPDGPRGPRRVTQPGSARLAALAGVPVVPIAVFCRPSRRLRSWDRMMLPLPFGRGTIRCGTPITVPRQGWHAGFDVIGRALDALDDDQPGRRIARVPAPPASARLWWLAGSLAELPLRLLLRHRVARGKELAARLGERRGRASLARPPGRLIWLHAASVGETVSLLPLLQALCRLDPALHVLMTTGSLTSQRLLAQRLPELGLAARVLHQFMPLDVPRWLHRFLAHWRPQAVALVESELWPNLIAAVHRRGLPLALLNARMSDRSTRRWQRLPRLSRDLLRHFSWITARSDEDALRLRALGAQDVQTPGDLKQAASALPVDAAELERVRAALGGRPILLAACTHDGEEPVLAAAHALLRLRQPGLLTIIAPRHPERGAGIAGALGGAPRRALGELPGPAQAFWVCDTLGELGLLYRLSPIAFLGNSLQTAIRGAGGGHNPFEPARLGCLVATGPLTCNFNAAFEALHWVEAVTVTPTAAAIADWADAMLNDPALRARRAEAARLIAAPASSLPVDLARRLLGLTDAA
ncbi:glycosyltransferase N-terminal domain-containing protein [Lichenicoccus sp.]|uniref:glycosyltransferase N-terminal domain-containing protein n=1 Tax=Lichenicoccus sp. TaxID=2781899 RepID=UPI003D0FED75